MPRQIAALALGTFALLAASQSGLAAVIVEDKMPANWRACQTQDDCTLIEYGCDGAAASNTANVDAAQKLAFQLGGDPRAISCPVPEKKTYVKDCKNNLCSISPVK